MFKADIALINGKVVTVDKENSVVEAVAVKDTKILTVGSTSEITRIIGKNTEVIDLKGKTVLPGIVDSHTHPSGLASRFLEIDCRAPPIRNISEILELVLNKAKELGSGKWVRGANFNDSKLEEKRHITRWELDEVAPENPVFIVADTGHQCLVNSYALTLAGITHETLDPPGGEIERDENEEPTGLLYETAQRLVSQIIPSYTVEELKESYRKVVDQFTKWGITSTHDASGHMTGIRAFKQLLDEGYRKLRISLMVSAHPPQPEVTDVLGSMISLGLESGFGDNWLKTISLKIMGDGSGAGGTASVYTPQNRGPQGLGLMMTDPKDIEDMTIRAHNAGIRVSIHSIGDKGIDIALDSIEKAQRLNPKPDMRHRIEHNSLCTPKQLERIKTLGVTPSSSIGYMFGLGDMYAENFGRERSRWLHPHKTMKEMEIIAGGNNDCPVTFYSPFYQIYAAVTRKTISGKVIGPQEAISIMEAIKVYTWNGAYLSKDEKILGSIEPGKLADMIIIDRDILEIPYEELKKIEVLTTIVNGKIVYKSACPTRTNLG